MPQSGAIGAPGLLASLCVACSSPGHVEGPLGTFDLRTAWYRVSPTETFVLLSNGELECGMTQLDDPVEQLLAEDELFVALCREGAQHVALRLYDLGDPPAGAEYPGLTLANEESVSPDAPLAANAIYYGVVEAFLADYEDLGRTYLAEEEVRLDLGDGGQVTVDTEAGIMSGWFTFPDMGESSVNGEFVAKQCPGDTELLDLVEANPAYTSCL